MYTCIDVVRLGRLINFLQYKFQIKIRHGHQMYIERNINAKRPSILIQIFKSSCLGRKVFLFNSYLTRNNLLGTFKVKKLCIAVLSY
jgi:hypothetical protein